MIQILSWAIALQFVATADIETKWRCGGGDPICLLGDAMH